MQHFRAAFEPIAREVLEVDTGALSTRNFKERPYRNVRRPIFPLDDI
jgi:microcystin degradation protein MlrC